MPAHLRNSGLSGHVGSNSYPGEQDCKSCASRGDRVGNQPQLNVRQRLALLRFAELAIPVERLVSMVHFVPFLVQHDQGDVDHVPERLRLARHQRAHDQRACDAKQCDHDIAL